MERSVSDIPAGDGEIANLVYSARLLKVVKGLFLVDILAEGFHQSSLLFFCCLVFLDFLKNQNKLVFLNFDQKHFCSTWQVIEPF